MAEEKKELTPEQKTKLEEFIKLQKETQEKIEKAGAEIGKILDTYGLSMVIDHYIKFVPKRGN